MWELFKTFLEEQLADLKDEAAIDEALKEVSVDEEKNKSNKQVKASHPCDYDEDYYDYDDSVEQVLGYTVQTKSESCKLCG